MIDPGHGGTDPGARAFGVQEKDWNLRISLYQYERLKELGAKVGITRTSDITLDSVPRTNKIRNKYDLCISNHWNAFNGEARGIETIHSIFGGKGFATDLANALVSATGLPLRRVFSKRNSVGTDWYFMQRLTGNTRTVIIEYGFLDNRRDHDWYKNNSNFIKAAEAVIEAVCKEIGITYKSPSGKVSKPSVPKPSATGKLYKVQAGAFQNIDNAEKLHERMQKEGIDAFVLKDGKFYKVQAGAYSKRENAERQLEKVNNLVGDAFIVSTGSVTTKTTPKPLPKKTYSVTVDGYMGPETVRALQSYFGLVVDGEMWGQFRGNQATKAFNQKAVKYGTGGSPVVKALQRKIGAKPVDGIWGAGTTRALQRYLGTPVDGEIWRPSSAIRELQRRLNNGTF